MGLDDATVDNGCLLYTPGGNRWGLLEKPVPAGEMDGLKASLSDEQKDAFKPIAAELKAGEAVFHHPLMVHGSFKNDSERPRRELVINVFKDGTVSKSDETLLNGVPAIPKDSKMEGRFFPLLFDPEIAGCQ